ncbi:putative ureohydrolase, manganese-binding protein [Dioscorea sansibarensis]
MEEIVFCISAMLQWTGGSRRKVTASRKSTHNRQKQYFEQRKRQQRAPGLENDSTRNKRANYYEELRSLDILSLINLETVTWQGYPNQTNVIGGPQVKSHTSKLSPAVVLKKIINRYSHDSQEACPEATIISPKKLPETNVSNNVSTANGVTLDLDGVKPPESPSKSLPTNVGTVPNGEVQTVFPEVSVFDLLSDDRPRNDFGGGSVPEPHVAFSVEGLGKIGMKTPAHSPRFQDRLSYRNLPRPPKVSRWIRSLGEHESVHGSLGFKLDATTNDIRVSPDGGSPESLHISSVMLDELENMEDTMFRRSCFSTDFFGDQFYGSESDGKYTFSYADCQRKQQYDVSFGLLDENFLDEMKYDAWKKKPFHADDCPSLFPEAKRTEVNSEDPFLDNFRTEGSTDKSFDFSGAFEKSAPLTSDFGHLTAERVYSANNKSANFETTIDPHAWSFTRKEDMHDNLSLFSEESCSSTAVGEERSYDFESQSIGIGSRHSNFNDWEQFHSPSESVEKFSAKKAIYAGLGRVCQKKNLVGSRRTKKAQNKGSPKGGHCLQPLSMFQTVWEPESIASFEEGFASTELDTSSFKCNLFSMPTPKAYFSAELKHGKSNFPADHGASKFCEGEESGQPSGFDFHLQKSGKQFTETEGYFLNTSHVGDFQYDDQRTSLPKEQSAAKTFQTFEKPENDVSTDKKSLSSENSITAVSQQPKDGCVDSEHSENMTQLNEPKTGNPCEVAIQHKMDHSERSFPVSRQVPNRDFIKEKDGVEGTKLGSDGGGSTDTSYQVMLESYVLQLLCVRKVLTDASKKDTKKV